MRETNPRFWGNSAQGQFFASLLGSIKTISVNLWSFLREGICGSKLPAAFLEWSDASLIQTFQRNTTAQGSNIFKVSLCHHWNPSGHDLDKINAFEQNLISIQRLYLCQAVLAKELEREVV